MIDRCARSRRKREGISEINSDLGRSNSFSLEIPSGLRLFISPIITIIISRERSSALANPEEVGDSTRGAYYALRIRRADAKRRDARFTAISSPATPLPSPALAPRRALRAAYACGIFQARVAAAPAPFTIRAASRGMGGWILPPPLHFPASRARIISPRAFIRIIRRC